VRALHCALYRFHSGCLRHFYEFRSRKYLSGNAAFVRDFYLTNGSSKYVGNLTVERDGNASPSSDSAAGDVNTDCFHGYTTCAVGGPACGGFRLE
jgi:hypothetical protein